MEGYSLKIILIIWGVKLLGSNTYDRLNIIIQKV